MITSYITYLNICKLITIWINSSWDLFFFLFSVFCSLFSIHFSSSSVLCLHFSLYVLHFRFFVFRSSSSILPHLSFLFSILRRSLPILRPRPRFSLHFTNLWFSSSVLRSRFSVLHSLSFFVLSFPLFVNLSPSSVLPIRFCRRLSDLCYIHFIDLAKLFELMTVFFCVFLNNYRVFRAL